MSRPQDLAGALGAAAQAGTVLDAGLRRALEDSFDVDLSAIRVHDDAHADLLARALDADAFASGVHLFFRDGAYRPTSRGGLALLAHEVAHAIQQSRGAPPDAVREHEAEVAAARVCAGLDARIGAGIDAVRPLLLPIPIPGGAGVVIQRHESFEHRALGDLPTNDIVSLTDPNQRAQIVERETQLMWLWHQSPEQVNEDKVKALCPWIRTTRLQPSNLLVTYGELNALPDYIASAQAIDACPADVMLPILQTIRQESYQQLNKLVGSDTNIQFAQAPFPPSQYAIDLLNKIFASWGLDDLTRNLGVDGIDHYTALLARNACHFSPFTWHRWQASYLLARGYAAQAHATTDSNDKTRLKHLAWLYHGYADHFLQDSFAAGHLINKTLAMQWFVEWAARSYLPVEDWDVIKNMTASIQPAFAGRQLYNPDYQGSSNDPQTVEENSSYDTRRAASGVAAYTINKQTTDIKTAYQQYLTFLSSVIAQTTANAIHDRFNTESLWVASVTNATPYQVYGDDTLFTGSHGGLGAQRTSEAATLSRQSIAEIIDNGTSSITTTMLRDTFPTRVGDSSTSVLPIEQWVDSKKQWTIDNILENNVGFWFKRIATQTFPRIVNLSQDQEFANKWYTSLPDSEYWQVDVTTSGPRMFAASYGRAYELDTLTGKVLQNLGLAGGYDCRVATDGKMLFVGCHGYVYGVSLNDWSKAKWVTSMRGSAYCMVNLLYANGRLFAGSNTYAMELDPATGAMKNSIGVSSAVGPEVRLATDGTTLYIGCYGYAYAMRLNDWSKTVWTAGMAHASYSSVALLSTQGLLFAGSNGTAIQLDPGTGNRLHDYTVTSAVNEEVRLATDGKTLAVGCNGYLTGIKLSDWSKAYATPLSGIGWKQVDVCYSNNVVYAGSNGTIHRVDPTSGNILNAIQLGYAGGSGDYTEQLALDDRGRLYIGMHGYAYAMS